MRFLPYAEASAVPNIVVDGAANARTVLALSHWPKSGTPAALKADTSTEIVFKYLDSPTSHVSAEAVSNNHFDEDGVLGVFALLQPDLAARHRALAIDAAQAGDFGVYASREAARVSFVLSAHAEASTSPFPSAIFKLGYQELTGELYVRLLDVLPALLADRAPFRPLWEDEDAKLTASEARLDRGDVAIEERGDLDLAIVRAATGESVHPFALHSRTPRTRLLLLLGRHAEVQYRYEGWVQMASRRPAPRVDLSALAGELNERESSGGTWTFDGVDDITPRLHLEGAEETTIPPEAIIASVEHHLRTGNPAWNPYDG